VSQDAQRRLVDDLVRELDLIVYRLETPPQPGVDGEVPRTHWMEERARLRRELESVRDRLAELADTWW
jgi:hypothetical protein